MPPIIKVASLRKEFRVPVRQSGRFMAIRSLFSLEKEIKTAVDGIDFSIEKGEMVGYVGPNGAGKSTTIKMLTGILLPSEGEVEVLGYKPHAQRQQLASQIGVIFGQKTQLWWDVPVIESLRLLKEIYKIPKEVYKANLELFNDLLDLHEFLHTPVRQLSLGQRMRSDLAAALLHNPELLLLDEPTIGVDVVAKDRFRKFMHKLNQERGVTVLLTTHDMSDIEKVCDRMMIIDQGKIIYDGMIAGIKDQFTTYRTLVVDFTEDVNQIDYHRTDHVQVTPLQARFKFDRQKISASELITDLAARYPVKDISVEEPEIEAIVREIYEGTAKDHLGELE